ncbi:flagellar biosynthetic protein FliO [Arthrobacter sp. zg-Y411]|uniref:flagellar biosynthetic protein FliO n=1 Tax=Arthrobacter zhangbolii TaxID=2886936 RepID=UPI001D15365E|nr:flagellar biosynthetic protein FliO [Arthrobacter zhangbolii]
METLFLGLRVLVSLGAVLGLLWWLQRRFARTNGSAASQPEVRVISRQPITPKASVVVLETGGQRFLLGVTEGSVNVLHTADAPEPAPDTAAAPDAGFAASLKAAGADGISRDPYAPVPAGHTADSRRAARGAHALPGVTPGKSPLSGSILSPDTWRQTGAVLRSRGRKG